ncbi:MAG: sulfurtransferase TusA family protein [Magnetovibrionaceae bacterium]
MSKVDSETMVKADVSLDITGDICPMTFVRTKLQLERLSKGQILKVRLKGAEPLANVPRSAQDQGDEVLSLEPESPDQEPDGVYVLLLRKG